MLVKVLKPVVQKFPRLAMTYRIMRDKRHFRDKPKDTPMGFKLMGNKLMQEGKFEPEETEIFKRFIRDTDIVINIGANIGYYCCQALSQGKYVIAFEPITLNVTYLLRNIRANNWDDQIEVYPMALSNKKAGVVEIYGGGTGASLVKGWAGTPDQHVNLVPSTTLDNIIGNKTIGKSCFILVDIEGAELYMLEGSSSILQMNPKPIWMVEISITEHQPKGVEINPNLMSTFNMFWENGYEARTANSELRVILPGEIQQIIESGNDTIHTHNFLFVENGNKQIFVNAEEN